MKKIICLISITLMASCKTTDTKENSNKALPQVNDQFQRFLDQFPESELPVIIRGCNDEYNLTEPDPVISSDYLQPGSYIYGRIKTNGNYIAIIVLEKAECVFPSIITYNLSGEYIESITIAIHGCNGALCQECSEYMTLKEDYTFYVADTIRSYNCNSNNVEIANTSSTSIYYRTGRLTPEGKIDISPEFKK